ncbi:hypothetical protein GQ602_000982 [Ophiocordyceps camponoti-floridani]|uniref:Uncharacterized protein n=1 Tax=Ophiocordyceps camponoti-floridani TaxID=2030778 RepID=A0A8H4QD58_9HYPO|nr:hypothetical protein GQ602_000982 [Ophiocordyceps camponoti-floridani]
MLDNGIWPRLAAESLMQPDGPPRHQIFRKKSNSQTRIHIRGLSLFVVHPLSDVASLWPLLNSTTPLQAST